VRLLSGFLLNPKKRLGMSHHLRFRTVKVQFFTDEDPIATFRGHVHIHVATHNVESTLWVGGFVFTSTPQRYLVAI
jgi:hypothetical protein